MSERCDSCANYKAARTGMPCMACVDNTDGKVDSMVRTSQYIAKKGAAPEPATKPAVAGGAGSDTDAVDPNANEDGSEEASEEDSEEKTE